MAGGISQLGSRCGGVQEGCHATIAVPASLPRFVVCGFGFRVSGLGFGFRVSGSGFRVSGFRFRVSGFGFRVLGFGVQDGHDVVFKV